MKIGIYEFAFRRVRVGPGWEGVSAAQRAMMAEWLHEGKLTIDEVLVKAQQECGFRGSWSSLQRFAQRVRIEAEARGLIREELEAVRERVLSPLQNGSKSPITREYPRKTASDRIKLSGQSSSPAQDQGGAPEVVGSDKDEVTRNAKRVENGSGDGNPVAEALPNRLKSDGKSPITREYPRKTASYRIKFSGQSSSPAQDQGGAPEEPEADKDEATRTAKRVENGSGDGNPVTEALPNRLKSDAKSPITREYPRKTASYRINLEGSFGEAEGGSPDAKESSGGGWKGDGQRMGPSQNYREVIGRVAADIQGGRK